MNVDIKNNLALVRQRLENACRKAGRSPESVLLLGVSKTHPAEALQMAYDCGLRDFGENYMQDWFSKKDDLPSDIRWHFIGHIQSNKAKKIAAAAHMLHSVDSLHLFEEINRRALEMSRIMPCLIEVNVGGEASKGGVEPEKLPELIESVSRMSNIDLRGLMSIPPFLDDAEEMRPFHATLRELRDKMERVADMKLPELSMGMSFDMEVAIEEGATIVRVGTDIFGRRT